MVRVSEPQLRLLAILPDLPSKGKLCKGAELNTANSLARMGLTQRVGVDDSDDACRYYFARTSRGRALAEGSSERAET